MCEHPQLVFDAATQGYAAWYFPAAGCGFLVVSSLLLWNERRDPQNRRRWMTLLMVAFSAVWTVVALAGTLGDYLKVRSALSRGAFEVVEGAVDNFVPQPREGHAMESFTVSGVPFKYSDYVVTAGFHQSQSHGGPITGGLHVRIGHLNGEILKLEICQ